MTPADKRELVLRRLLENITQTRSNHISSGIIGTYYVFQTLMEEGHDDVAYAMLTQKDFPGWLHMLNQGGTTVWEAWNGKGSRNHPAFGSVGAWFYRGLGGIRLDPTTPAFKRFVIKPAVVGDLTWVKCSYQSAHGKIESNWRREAGKLRLAVTIPFNTTATVHVPTSQPDAVTESGQSAGGANGVKFLRAEKAAAIYEVGSGNYVFEGPFSLTSSKER
jgi:alpha-L-rhamnosidase